MPGLFDNGCEKHLDPHYANRLERAGLIVRCTCETACDGPNAAYHLAPGKTLESVRFHLYWRTNDQT